MAKTLQEFKEYELYPALWERIDQAFPDMNFTFKGGYWRSSKHIDGSDSHSSDQTFVHFRKKHLIRDNADSRAHSLIDFEMMRSGTDFSTALYRLSAVCGLTPPSSLNSEEQVAYQRRQDDRDQALTLFKKALWSGTEGANEVLTYLRDERKWTDEEIQTAELGYIDEAILFQLADRSEFAFTTEKGDKIGYSHRLIIPYRNGTRLFGFKARDIHKGGAGKYLNTRGLSKGKGLFGIGVGVKDLTIVEGELDALHAQVRGIDNIVATTGNGAGEEQIQEAMRRGCKRFTLLFDSDERAQGVITPFGTDDKEQGFVLPSMRIIQAQGGEVYVATIPDGEGKDVDEYLQTHSADDLRGILTHAITAAEWQYNRLRDRLVKSLDDDDNLSFKARDTFFDEIEKLLNAPTTKPQEREYLFGLMECDEADLKFKVADIRAYLDKSYLRAKEKQRTEATAEALSKAQAALQGGKVDEALHIMRESASKRGATDKETEFARIFQAPSSAQLLQSLASIQEGIPTGILFKQGTQSEALTLNAGLTFICGCRGHGKTTFLNNIALNETRRNLQLKTGKSVLYFSYEVDKRRLISDLLGTYVNDASLNRAKNPQDAIISYFKGNGQWISRRPMNTQGVTHFQNFETKKDDFFRRYLSSGALIIVDESYKVEKLLDALRYYLTITRPSIVCIDYAQLIYSEDYSRLRTEEIKRVVNDIKDFANKQGIPFVLAAQFNREVASPISVDTKNIGEGGDFERIADTVVGIFNLKELHTLAGQGGKDEERDAKKLLQSLGVASYDRGEDLKPIQGKLFLRLLKRRYGYYPLDTVLEWEGRTKHITLNDESALFGKQEEQPRSLFADDEEDTPF